MSIQDLEPLALATRYPEEYLVSEDEDDVSTKNAHTEAIFYLMAVFKWLYRQENWLVVSDIILRHPLIQNSQRKIVPDIDVFKGIEIKMEERPNFSLWDIDEQHPAPPVVVEICSEDTAPTDIGSGPHDKPAVFGRIGVKEYFAYDPFEPPVWRMMGGRRLLGWRYEDGQVRPIEPEREGIHTGRLRSHELDSWLEADGDLLRLYDEQGQPRLTKEEASEQRAQVETIRRLQAERQAFTAQRKALEAAQRAAHAEQRAVEAEEQNAELRRLLEQAQRGRRASKKVKKDE